MSSKITKEERKAGDRLRRALDNNLAGPQRGRPSLYRPGFCELATRYCLLGATNEELGSAFGVTDEAIIQWLKKYPDFKAAVYEGRAGADARVAHSLYQRANGVVLPDTHVHVSADGDVTKVPLLKHYPPDTTAGIFWLKNRRPQHWKDRIEHTGEGGGPVEVKVSIVKAPLEKIIEGRVIEKKEEKK